MIMNTTQVRTMATLKDIAIRLKSVKNIQKITASMKMVSAAKYNKAERELRPAKSYGLGATKFIENANIQPPEEANKEVCVAISSDRGLCGAANTSVIKAIKAKIEECGKENVKVVGVGDKTRSGLQRLYGNSMLIHFNEVGKKPATFTDASVIAQGLIEAEHDFPFNKISVYYNKFKSVVAYETKLQPVFPLSTLQQSESLTAYDSVDENVIASYNEFMITSIIYYALKEGQCSEQSARMTAMDGASKNAGEMIDKLTLTYNRTRQAVITKELTEIVSGAAAVA